MEYLELFKMAAPLLAIGGAWGGAKVALNGTRERVKNLEESDDKQNDKLSELANTATRIETKQDMLIEYIKEKK
jgi:hypothetical protein